MHGYLRPSMRGKRFKTRSEWHNVKLWSLASGFIVIVLGILALQERSALLWTVAIVGPLTGFAIAWYRDRGHSALYSFDGEHVMLRGDRGERQIPMGQVADVSLLDRTAAREYLKQMINSGQQGTVSASERQSIQREFMRFCTVDIGMTSYSLGVGRRMIDELPDAKRDLVLLRLRNGEALLLSPLYNHDLVESLGRVLQERVSA